MNEPVSDPSSVSAPEPVATSGPATVLIADNDTAVNGMLAAILSGEGLQAESAYDGEQAIARLERGDVDVLVTDLDMPKLDGQGLLDRVADLPEPPATLVISGYLDSELQSNLESRAMVRHVLHKPFDIGQFSQLVSTCAKDRAVDA